MNLHLSSYYSFSSGERYSTSEKWFFQTPFPKHVNPAFYRVVLFGLFLVMFSLSAFSQVKPSGDVPQINTNSGGIMLNYGGDGGGGSSGGTSCINPSFTTNLSTTYTVTVNSTTPLTLTVAVSNYTSLQWYQSTNSDGSAAVAISNATSTSYAPDVSTVGTLYYFVVASNYCGSAESALATVTVTDNTQTQAVAGTINGASTVCSGTNSTDLTLVGYTGTIQWQSSTDNTTFTDIANANSVTYTATNLTATTYYQAVVTSGTTSATSPAVTMTVNPAASAGTVTAGTTPECIGSSTTYTVSGVVLGGGTGSWSSDNTAVATVDANGKVTAVGAGNCNIIYTVTGGCGGTVTSSQPYTVTAPASAGTVTAGTTPECIGSTTTYTVSGAVLSGGTGSWSSDNTAVATVDASGKVTAVGAGTCNIVYTVTGGCGGTVTASQPYTVTPPASAGTVTAGTTPECIGSTTTYTVSGAILSGGTGSWSSDNTAVATVDASTGVVNAVGAGTCNIVYTVTGGCGGTVTASQPYTVTPPASAGTVTAGTSPQCIGSTTTYTVSGVVLGGGTGGWSSNNTAVATVDASGNVTAVGAGTCNIVYTVTGGCGGTVTSSQSYTVNPAASAGTVTAGTTPQCIGSSTTYTVSNVVLGGGTGGWSSDNTAVATVDANGNVTAVGAGTCNIIYTVTGGCGGTVTSSQSYSVNPNANPGTVSGATPQCIGSTTTFTTSGVDLEGGTGSWSSDNTAVATVDATTGKVTALSPGTCNIIYTVTGGCGGTVSSSQSYTVNTPPSFTLTPTLTNLYFGVPGNQSSTITATLTGGSGESPYTVTMTMVHTNADGTPNSDGLLCNVVNSSGNEVWTANGGTTKNNSCGLIPISTGSITSAGETYSVTVTLIEDADINVTITDKDGCVSSTQTVHIAATDARCLSGKSGSDNKVSMCHITNNNKYVQVCIDDSAVNAHLAAGDLLGSCPVSYRQIFPTTSPETFTGKLEVSVLPNPSSGQFSLLLKSGSNDNVNLKVVDLLGRVVEQRSNVAPNSTLQIGSTYSPGVYFVQLLQGKNIVNLKLIKKQN